MKNKKFNFLLSPWLVLFGMSLGIIIGIYFKDVALLLKPIGDIYISVLKMCILPIMVSAVLVSLSKLLRSNGTNTCLKKITYTFIFSILAVALLSTAVGVLTMPFINGHTDMKKQIGKIMLQKNPDSPHQSFTSVVREIDSRFHYTEEISNPTVIDFILDMIPRNIFLSLANEYTLQIVFFFIVLGIMMKFVSEDSSNTITSIFEGVFEAFQKIINFAMYFLPLGLCALMASQFKDLGLSILLTLAQFIIVIYICCFAVFLTSTIIIWKYTKQPYFSQFSALKDAILLAIGTRSSYAALPSAISGLVNNLKMDHAKTHLIVPLGFTLCKYGKILIFCIGTVFAANLYDYNLGIQSFVIIVISSSLAGMAASGAPSIVSRGMITIVLAPLGIPAGAIIVILLAIDPIVDPFITLISTYPNYAIAAVISQTDNNCQQKIS